MKKMEKLSGLCLTFLLFIAVAVDAQMVMTRNARTLTTSNGDTFYAYEYRPQGYNPSDTILHPLIIFLHGIGEVGNYIDSLPKLEIIGLPYAIKVGSPMTFEWNGKTESFVVMAPMSRQTSSINNLSKFHYLYVQATIDYAVNNLKVDPNRIYLTGLSYGGGGTLNYISANYSYTQRIAAAAPVSTPAHFGSNGPTYVKNANLPLWAFVGANDPLTPPSISQNVVSSINALSPTVRAKLSIIPNAAHNPATYNAVYYHQNHPNGVYEDPISVYEWFLGQDKSLPPNVLPVANAGNNQNIYTNPGTAVLDGSGSTDSIGIVRYLWKQISGPKTITITKAYTSSVTAAAAYETRSISGLTTAGTYRFELTVVDVRAGISKDTVDIVASAPPIGPSGKAVTITGSLGRIATGDVTELKNASRFTLEAQFKYDSTVSTWTTIMRKSMASTPPLTDRIMLHIGPNNNSIYVMVGNGSNSYGHTAANAVSPGTWFHVAAVFDGTQTGNANRLKLYIDGVQQVLDFDGTVIPASTSGTNSAPFMAGGEPGCCNLNGTIDEVRVWDTALSAATLSDWKDKLLGSCHPNAANLVVYWPLDDNANPAVATAELGTTYTGNIINGSYIGSSQATDTTGCNTAGKAVTITGSLGRIATGDVTELKNASRFTLEAQFKYDSTVSTWTTIMRKSMASTPPLTDRIMLHIGPNNNSIYVMVGNGSNSYGHTAANAVSPGTWFHVAAVFDGTQTGNANRLKLYIDGVQQVLDFDGTVIPASTSGTNSAPFMAGGEPGCCNLNGTIDEVRVWDTALSAATLSDWKDKLLGSCHPNVANLVVYWPLDDNANPAVATAELGTTYTGNIINGSYVGGSQATDTTGCNTAGKAVTITGSLGRIATGDVTELKNASRFTLEAQFKYDSTVSTWTTIMRKSMASTPPLTDRIMLHIGPNNNSIYVMVGNGSNSYGHTAANAVSPGTWFHVAAVFDGTQTGNANRLKLYIDGVQQVLDFDGTVIPASTSSTNSAPFMAGGEPGCCNLNGTIDEVRVWDTALSAATLSDWKDKLLGSCHPNAANLVVYWPLDDNGNPAVATAELGTTYTGNIINGSYVGSSQATASSGCNSARVGAPPFLETRKENRSFATKIYPNPSDGLVQLELQLPVSTLITINVVDMSGRYVHSIQRPLVKGKNRILLNIASLRPGTYIIEAGDGKSLLERYKVSKR